MSTPQRPLSPHLQIYRPQLTSVLSILHRMTGGLLFLSSLMLVGWLAVIAMGIEWFECYYALCTHPVGCLALSGVIFAFFYHLFNGIRHLIWDMGYGFSLSAVYRGGYIVLALSLLSTTIILILLGNH